MLVSVVMATTAAPGWDGAVADLSRQTYAPIQIVVVVDRPCEAGEQARLSSAYPQVDFVFNGANLGLTTSLNRGLAAAKGEIVVRTDDDDRSRPDRIAKQVAALQGAGADLVCSFAHGVSSEDPNRPWIIDHPTTDAGLKAALLRRNVVVHPSLAFRRDRILALGGYDETFRYSQDYALYLKATRAGYAFAVVAEPLVTRSYSPGSITVRRRTVQMMYSAMARLHHAAEQGDVGDFLSVLLRRGSMLLVPNALRRWRRIAFRHLGRGA